MDADDYGCADIIDVAVVRRCVGMDSSEMVNSISICGGIASLYIHSVPQCHGFSTKCLGDLVSTVY